MYFTNTFSAQKFLDTYLPYPSPEILTKIFKRFIINIAIYNHTNFSGGLQKWVV